MDEQLKSVEEHAEERAATARAAATNPDRPGWLTFAAVVMFSVGVLQFISAIYFLANSTRINDLTNGAFGAHAWVWGIWDLVLAALSLTAGYSLLRGHTYGRVITYLWAGLVTVEGFLMLRQAPWSGFLSVVLAVLVIYAVSSTSGWAEKG
jgi:hypothetical protein